MTEAQHATISNALRRCEHELTQTTGTTRDALVSAVYWLKRMLADDRALVAQMAVQLLIALPPTDDPDAVSDSVAAARGLLAEVDRGD